MIRKAIMFIFGIGAAISFFLLLGAAGALDTNSISSSDGTKYMILFTVLFGICVSVELTIVVDCKGLDIFFYDIGESTNYYKFKEMSSVIAEGEIKHLIAYLEKYTCASDITYVLDHPDDDAVRGFSYIGCYKV